MKKTFEIAKIIHRYLLGEISEEEQFLLDEWVEQSEHHQEMLREFRRMEYLDENILRHRLFDSKKGLRKFEERKRRALRRLRWVRVASVAAVVCCVASVALFLSRRADERKEIARIEAPIVPGGYRAVLVLDNGQHVELSDEAALKVKEKSAVISVEDNHIVYPKEDSIQIEAVNRVFTPRGGEYSLELSDGTNVWLNADSELRYPVRFKGDCREVEITGEAYFEVAKNADRPFVVYADGMKIRVLGTSFNVRAYENEKRQTTLIEGSVEVAYGSQQVKIVPGQQVMLSENRLVVREVNTWIDTGWKNGLFVFEEQPLTEGFRELERWYDVHIFIANEEIKRLKFTSDFPRYEDIDRVLRIIELAACVKCEVRERTIVVRADN